MDLPGLGVRSKHVARLGVSTYVLLLPLLSGRALLERQNFILLWFARRILFLISLLRCAEICQLKMRWSLSLFLFGFLAVVHALSSSGNRLLVVLEDGSEKDLYSTFWSDLEGMNFHLDVGRCRLEVC